MVVGGVVGTVIFMSNPNTVFKLYCGCVVVGVMTIERILIIFDLVINFGRKKTNVSYKLFLGRVNALHTWTADRPRQNQNPPLGHF